MIVHCAVRRENWFIYAYNHYIIDVESVCLCVRLSVCVSSPSGVFCAARTRPLTPLLASLGHDGVTPCLPPPNPTPLISN